jgi:HemY protein
LRSGDSSEDRLNRARALARLAPDDAESKLTVARAAIGAREFGAAREAMSPLIAAAQDSRPSNRVCLLMADLEEAENGPSGMVREWLARASRAPRDKAWVADGVISDSWAPFSPISGQLDAWRWQTPPERLSHSWDPSSVVEEPQATLGKPDEIDREAQMEAPAAPQIAPPREPVKNFALGGAPDDPGPQRA